MVDGDRILVDREWVMYWDDDSVYGRWAMNELPERINAIKCVSYDVDSIVDAMMTMEYRDAQADITIEDILEWIGDDVETDINFSEVIYQDENGGEL